MNQARMASSAEPPPQNPYEPLARGAGGRGDDTPDHDITVRGSGVSQSLLEGNTLSDDPPLDVAPPDKTGNPQADTVRMAEDFPTMRLMWRMFSTTWITQLILRSVMNLMPTIAR
jgi:hypothetical protein